MNFKRSITVFLIGTWFFCISCGGGEKRSDVKSKKRATVENIDKTTPADQGGYGFEDLAEELFNLVQEEDLSNLNFPKNIDYYLFYLNLALDFKPQFNEVFFIQAQVYQELQYYLKAEELYNKIQPQHSLYIEAQKLIVINKKNNSKFNEAEKSLIKLIGLFPDNHSLIILLADLYRANKQYDKAIEFYTLLIKEKIFNRM